MKTTIEHLRQTRKNMLAFFDKHEEIAHVVPEGYNNTIYWNFAHCIVTQQLLVYRLSDNDLLIDQDVVEKYRKGTKVSGEVPSSIEIGKIKDLALTGVDLLEQDYEAGMFKIFNEYSTSFGVTLLTVEDALKFNNLHEALHLGYMMSMVKKIKS